MLLFYRLLTQLYFFSIRIAAIFNEKASKMIRGRKGWQRNLKEKIIEGKKYIWFHCASLGEFEQGRPLIEKFKTENPEYGVVLSFFSPSGYEIRKNYEFADVVCYLPFDSKHNAEKFIEIINPEFVIFVKYEFWYFMINRLVRLKIPVFLISGIFRKNQIFFKPYGRFYLKLLKRFSYLFLQDEDSEILLKNFGVKNTLVCGDTRIDRVIQIADQEWINPLLDEFSKGYNIIVCGSSWPEDEKIITEFINSCDSSYKFIIAPHEITEKHLSNLENEIKKNKIRYSDLSAENNDCCNVLIVDSIGLLSKLYRYGRIAYIGGGFGKGIHNILEASVYNIPVVFGPNYKKFKEAIDLIEIKAGFSISDYDGFKDVVNKLISEQSLYENSKMQSEIYFDRSSQSTKRIFQEISNLLKI